MGHDFSSPKNEAELTWDVEDVKEDELLKLKKASDIMLAFWLRNLSVKACFIKHALIEGASF